MNSNQWYTIDNIDALDTPCLVVYPDRIKKNIRSVISSASKANNLRPHIKTNKSAEVCKMMLDAGITKFKCATIAESEMLAEAGAPDILLAYQPVGPGAKRFQALTEKFSKTKWSCLIDNIESAKAIDKVFADRKQIASAHIDLNVGMDRTGISPQNAFRLFEECQSLNNIKIIGLHAYDGHIRDTDFQARTKKCDEAFKTVKDLQQKIQQAHNETLTIVAGGTPTFSVHCKRPDVECSPGTFVYWDRGYEKLLPEQHYLHAALVVTRVVSLPAENIICIDLGHKAIAAENPVNNRVYFLNAPELEPLGHSEEHMTLKSPNGKSYKVGDILYGVPYHVCPTVALHDVANVVEGNRVVGTWQNKARQRRLTI
jgi:D-threonine aldolase